MNEGVTLVGDSIENPANALVMVQAARMFGAACRFRDTKGLAQSSEGPLLSAPTFPSIEAGDLGQLHPRMVAFDNLPGAAEVYGYEAGRHFGVMVGNERRGLSYECARLATDKVQVPMLSRRINCLNVAAASAVALYCLCGTRVSSMATRGDPGSRRPEVLLLGAGDHVELGSAIRSTTAFGWGRVLIEDRQQVWFGCDRAVRSQGRAAAGRGRNEILCIPCPAGAAHAFARVTVITVKPEATPLHRVNLARGCQPIDRHRRQECRGWPGGGLVSVGKRGRVCPFADPGCGVPVSLSPYGHDRPGRDFAPGGSPPDGQSPTRGAAANLRSTPRRPSQGRRRGRPSGQPPGLLNRPTLSMN